MPFSFAIVAKWTKWYTNQENLIRSTSIGQLAIAEWMKKKNSVGELKLTRSSKLMKWGEKKIWKHLPYSFGRVAKQRVWELMKGTQLGLEHQSGNVDCDAFTEIVPVNQWLKSWSGTTRQHDVSMRSSEKFVVFGIAQTTGAAAARSTAAFILRYLRYWPA